METIADTESSWAMRRKDDPRAVPVPPLWDRAIEQWEKALKVAGRTGPTIRMRGDTLRRLAREIGVPSPGMVTDVRLIEWASKNEWAQETRRSIYAGIRGFYEWAQETGITINNPAKRLPAVKPATPAPRPAPEQVYRDALTKADARTRLLLRLGAEVGLRRAEIAQIHARDIFLDLYGYSLKVYGKGGKVRYVPLTASLVAEMQKAGDGYLFPNGDGKHLTPHHLGKLDKRVLTETWTLHTLRHRFATVTHTATHDLLAVQRLLGHSSVATTQRYIAVSTDALRAVVATAQVG